MLVSIIMPVYNAADYLKESVSSVLNQTYRNWELIAVNDGSTDDSLQILHSFNDARIKIYDRPNGGQCAATNDAIRIAQGEFIQLLDADDVMHPDKTRVQLEELSSYGQEYLGISKWAFFYNSPDDAIFKDEPVFFSGDPVRWLHSLWSNDTMMHTNSYMLPHELLKKGGSFFDETLKLNVDFEFFTRMTLASKGVLYSGDAIGYYRKGVKGSKTFNASFEKQLSALKARVISIKYLLALDQSDMAKEASRMALTILTFSYPRLLPLAKMHLQELGLGSFGDFGGRRFKSFSNIVGFENAIRIKKFYQTRLQH